VNSQTPLKSLRFCGNLRIRHGQDMGHKIGKYVADHVMQPLTVAGGR
jgi:hypothetical protein